MTTNSSKDGPRDVTVKISRISVGDATLSLPPVGVTALVGGNNVGKSTLLREVNRILARGSHVISEPDLLVVDDVEVCKSGTTDQLRAWILQNTHESEGSPGYFTRMGSGTTLRIDLAESYWVSGDYLGNLSSFFVHYSEALSRVSMVTPVAQRDNISWPPEHPLHVLQDDETALEEVDQICFEIFRQNLTLDRLSGLATLRVGRPGVEPPAIDAVTGEYRQALVSLPMLDNQGDGMKSLIGLLLPVVTATYPIVLIDEPEAFLHPPQAYLLGKKLAQLASSRSIQILLATHDRNLLAGLTSGESEVSVIRLDRAGGSTTVKQLTADQVSELWGDPAMRYGNVLEGLFHRAVIIAEADPDCRFYTAAIDAIDEHEKIPLQPNEILFIPSNGKDGMAKLVRSLAALDVNVVACPDLDILQERSKLKRLVEAFGRDWAGFEADYRGAMRDFTSMPVDVTCGQVVRQLQLALQGKEDDPWTETVKNSVKPVMRTHKSEMSNLKRFGMASFTGQGAVHAKELIAKLDAIGICCVLEGELERLAPDTGVSKGPAWLPAALESGAHREEKAAAQARRLLKAAQR